jgi:Cytochrome c3/Cytochrome c7 and related cytochrome c
MKINSSNIQQKIHGLLMSFFSIILTIGLFSPSAFAQQDPSKSSFNHTKTGFILSGTHSTVQCESCHVGGTFRGTPKNCAGCHSAGRRVVATVKSAKHIPTNIACENCHTNTISFLGARFNHAGVQPKSCNSCHNGNLAPGKPAKHLVTNASCDTCHRTTAWLPSTFSHNDVKPGSCVTCHNGVVAIGKPSSHILTNESCDNCHTSGFTTFVGATFKHQGVLPGQCGTCHNGASLGAKKQSTGHIPYQGNACDACHTNFTSFTGAKMNHAVVTATSCATCHSGSYTSQGSQLGGAKAKPSNHLVTTASCDVCHTNFTSFLGATFSHNNVVAGTCGTCHIPGTNGARIKTTGHIPTTGNACDSCHKNFASFAAPTMNHAAVTATSCITCHGGAYTTQGSQLGGARAKPSNHPVTTASCDQCHTNFTTFLGANFNHAGVTPGTCGTCHIPGTGGARMKTAGHIPTTGNACDSCHKSYIAFAGATMNHAAVTATSCITCHGGAYTTQGSQLGGARAKPSNHPVTTASCDQCHTNFTTFLGANFNHAGVTPGTCGTCHIPGTGGARMKTAGHIPTTGNACDSCHKSYIAFAGATMNHAAVTATSCITCHGGAYTTQGSQLGGARAKPSNHLVTTASCDQCHTNFTTFLGAKFNHAGVAPGTCGTCHIPGTGGAKMKTIGHIPTTGNGCDSCHKSVLSFIAPTMSHTAVATTRCDVCHNGAYLTEGTQLGGAKAKPSNHIPTTITGSLDCNTCHLSTSIWSSVKMNHNGAVTGCKTCHSTTSPYLANVQKRTLGNHEGSTVANDCSQSGCHRPLGNEGITYVSW